jgi:hypothetical protein
MRARNTFVGAAFALLAGGMAHSAVAQEIKIGEINSYSLLPAFTEPYRKGSQSNRSTRPAASTARSSSSSPRTTAASRPMRRPLPTSSSPARGLRC